MPVLILPLLFLATGWISIWYFSSIPSSTSLRSRLPNRASWASIILTALIGVGIWVIAEYATTRFLKIAGITTLLFYLLTFESILLLMFRWTKSNVLSVTIGIGLTALPFFWQFFYPSYALSNALIIIATLGATALVIKLDVLRARVVMIMTGLFMINDIVNVMFFLPNLPLTPPGDVPYRLLILPTVNIGGHVVGSGDFMFLALTTLALVREFSPRVGVRYVAVQSAALAVTLALIVNRDVLIPYLVVMTPIFFMTVIFARRARQRSLVTSTTSPDSATP